MTDAEIIADMFGPPCNISPADEEVTLNCDCEHFCGSEEQTDAACWKRYLDFKRKEEQYLLNLGWKPTRNSNGELTLVRFSNPRIGFKPASGTLIIGYHEYPNKITSIEQLFSIIGKS